jgi:Na+/proline symporter
MIIIVVLTVLFLVFIVLIGLYARRADRLREEGSPTGAPHDPP